MMVSDSFFNLAPEFCAVSYFICGGYYENVEVRKGGAVVRDVDANDRVTLQCRRRGGGDAGFLKVHCSVDKRS